MNVQQSRAVADPQIKPINLAVVLNVANFGLITAFS